MEEMLLRMSEAVMLQGGGDGEGGNRHGEASNAGLSASTPKAPLQMS